MVVIVCRNASRASQVVRNGAVVKGCLNRHATPIAVRSIDDLTRFEGIDLIFVATKTTAIPQLAPELKSVLEDCHRSGSNPTIISFQNGIEPGRELIHLLDCHRVLRMVVNLGATLDGDEGAASVHFNNEPHVIGCLSPTLEPAARQVAALLKLSGLVTVFESDIEAAVWRKAIANAAANPVCALVNSNVGDVLDSPSCTIVKRLLEEGFDVARTEGLNLGDDYLEDVWKVLLNARDHTPSMVEDIRAGRPSEVGQLNRQIMEHGRRIGVATPTHELIDALIETFDFRTYRLAGTA